jgi:hypothetical protein
MMSTPAVLTAPRVRWTWLTTKRSDLVWNIGPYWLGYLLVAALYLTRSPDDAGFGFQFLGHPVNLGYWILLLYGPFFDAPHIWATLARTYADPDEWRIRRSLFLGSLVWFGVGPVVILAPYAVSAFVPLSPQAKSVGWVAWGEFFTIYALWHFIKQHWGFVALYKRKNADLGDEIENLVDKNFFYATLILPYFAMLTAPWYPIGEGQTGFGLHVPISGTTSIATVLHPIIQAAYFVIVIGYVGFQITRWQRGAARNGPKLAYLATIVPLHYLAFTLDPRVLAFWPIIIGVGHCMQYQRIVWSYGTSKYAPKEGEAPRLTTRIFANVWVYAVLAFMFGIVALQGPGGRAVSRVVAHVLGDKLFTSIGSDIGAGGSVILWLKVVAAVIGGVRLHHFYVDSKIWKVSKSPALAKQLDVEMKAAPAG